jgi:hypothetical protein
VRVTIIFEDDTETRKYSRDYEDGWDFDTYAASHFFAEAIRLAGFTYISHVTLCSEATPETDYKEYTSTF